MNLSQHFILFKKNVYYFNEKFCGFSTLSYGYYIKYSHYK